MTRDPTPATGAPDRPGTAIQLHTLAAMPEPLDVIVRRVARAGYDGVEFAGRFLETDPGPVRTALEETGTRPVGAHVGLSRLSANPERVVDRCRAVGCRRVVIPHVGSNHFLTTESVDALADRLSALSERLAADGVELAYHNSLATLSPPLDQFGLGTPSALPLPYQGWRRIASALGRASGVGDDDIGDRTGLGRLLERTPDALAFEVDVGWVAAAGHDPAAVFDLVGDRLAAVHVADVAVTGRFPRTFGSVSPGEGLVDIGRVVPAARRSDAEWLVFEDDDADDAERAIERGVDVLSVTGASGGLETGGETPEETADEPRSRGAVVEPEETAGDD